MRQTRSYVIAIEIQLIKLCCSSSLLLLVRQNYVIFVH